MLSRLTTSGDRGTRSILSRLFDAVWGLPAIVVTGTARSLTVAPQLTALRSCER
jgi:hypothetical protein